jgi:hypothetical protein
MEMGTSKDIDAPLMLEVSCPEYYATEIGRIEPAGGDNLRIYMCVRKGKILEPMFSVVLPIAALALCARQSLKAASDHHNELVLSGLSLSEH